MAVDLRRPTLVRVGYVLVVASVATVGFTTDSTAAILLAAVLALPSGVLAIIGFYLVYGLLAQVPGASPPSDVGWMACTSAGACHGWSAGGPAPWFTHATDVVGVVALTIAAVLNVMVFRMVVARRRSPVQAPHAAGR